MLTELLLIIEENERFYKTLKGNHLLVRDDVGVLQAKPIHISVAPGEKLKPTVKMNLSDKVTEANALLLGEKIEARFYDYYPASYCRVKSLS